MAGGVFGIFVAVALSRSLATLLGWPHFISPLARSTAVVFSTIVGIFFGY
jgi:hypothetical protein